MFLKGALRLKKNQTRFLKFGGPWVYSNELEKIETSLPPGSWVTLEAADGQPLAYGHFNPHSLIAFRAFERAKFRTEDQTRALFFRRLDQALELRLRTYGQAINTGQMGPHSFRLAFGESDGVPGLVIDLYEQGNNRAAAVIQCHSAGADQFLAWAQNWLEHKLKIDSGVIRNDVEVRRKENVPLEVREWGKLERGACYALEGGIRFGVDPTSGQKTGYFYDHRDNRAELARRCAGFEGEILDCFSYVGSWGLQLLKAAPKARLLAVDVSSAALEAVQENAKSNGLDDRVRTLKADFFKDKKTLGDQKFGVVVSDPPALTSSAKQAAEGRRAHESCFHQALGYLQEGGLIAFASCSFHLTQDEFSTCIARAGLSWNRALKLTYLGGQAADHPVLTTLPESRYLKCAFGEALV